MKSKLQTGKTRIIIMLVSFIVVLAFVGVLMQSKMRTLMNNYVERQVVEQAKILAEVLEENLTSELENLEEIAWYIESETADMSQLLKMAEKDGKEVNWGVLELGGKSVYGAQLSVVDYVGIQDSFRGNKAVSYKAEDGE